MLPVHVRDKGSLLQLRTKAIEITVDKSRATLTLLNLLTNANWVFSFAPIPPAQPVSVQRQQNTWSIATPGAGTLKVELLHPSLVRITSTGPGSLRMHAEGTAPIFGLGERFFQAGLADTHLDVRPADKSGEPGHNWVYVAIPFVYTPTGLGLYADTIFDTRFSFNQAGSSFDFETANHAVSYGLMCGADGKAILGQYTGITGRPRTRPCGPSVPGSTQCREKMRCSIWRRESAKKASRRAHCGF